jgi:salicylate hydroxylase
VHTGYRLAGLADGEDGVEARFENGSRVHVDVLVGADGIHSQVRSALFGPESPSFTGCVAYRGLIPAERLAQLDLEVTAQMWLGPGGHFVHYFVQSQRLVNFVGVVDRDSWTRESWTDRGEIADALAAFAGWHPQVQTILNAVDHTFIWALFDRAPLASWSGKRVTLLGDACHPMLPFMAQGAGQAIEDGAALAALLSRANGREIAAALRRYEELRLPRTARIQGMARENKVRFHLPDGPEQEERDSRMATGATDFSLQAVAWLYGHDARVVDAVE